MEKLKLSHDSWDNTKLSFEKDRAAYVYSWPQRNYRCSFCKRDFKSAQALGGHMNVHRRDRARMMTLPPNLWDSPNPNSNPNPSLSSSSLSTRSPSDQAYNKFLPYKTTTANCHSSLSSSVSINPVPSLSFSPCKEKVAICGGGDDRGKKNKGEMQVEFARSRKDARVLKENNDDHNKFFRLDLNMGLMKDVKEDLDLELRLGYSN